MPFVNPVTSNGLAAPVAVSPPGLDVTVYAVIGLPPFETGAVKLTVAVVLPATADPIVGAPARAPGVMLLEGAEGNPVPATFVAVTVNVYAVPFVSPVTSNGLVAPVVVRPSGLDVTVYAVIALPPFQAGATKLTVAVVLPARAAPIVGASGTVAGVTLLEGAEGSPTPTAFVAVTVNRYATPFVRPVTVIGLSVVPVAVMEPGFDVTV